MLNVNEILKKVKQELSSGLPFMEGREKGNIVYGYEFTIKQFGFLTDNENNRDYVCFIVEEDKEHFFFGGGVVTEKLQQVKEILNEEELKVLMDNGLKVMFENKKSKDKNRDYSDIVIL